MSPPANLFELLARRVRQRPEAPLCYRGGRAVSNREAFEDALALAAGLRRRLGEPSGGTPVLAAMSDDPYELHRVIWATRAAGFCLAFLPAVSDPGRVGELMAQVGARHLLTDAPGSSEPGFASTLADLGVGHPRSSPDLPSPVGAPGPAFLLRTSGTTGTGKWVAAHDRQHLGVLESMRDTGALRHAEDQVAWITPPLSHSYGLSTLLEYVYAGSAVAFPRGTSPLGPAGELGDGEIAERITAIEGVPYFYGQLARLSGRVRLPALRHAGFGGGKVDADAVARLRQVYPGLTYSVRYGMTETPSIVSGRVFHPPDEDGGPCSGRVLPVWELRIVDEAGRLLPDGEEGEIHLRGPCLAWPYYGEPEAGDAFFATGDLGVLAGGRLEVRGRKSLFLKHAGFRFSPEEVETVIRRFDGVADVRVTMGDGELTAELVSADGEVPIQALRRFAAERLPAYAVPRNLVRVAEIPRTESGKIKRGPGLERKDHRRNVHPEPALTKERCEP